MDIQKREDTMGRSDSKPALQEKFERKVTILILLVGLAPLMVVTGVAMDQYRDAYRVMAHSYLEERVQKHARLIDLFLEERLRDISYCVQASSCEQLQDKAYLKKQLDILQRESGHVFTDMGVVETHEEGRQITYAGPLDLERVSYGAADWFEQASRKNRFISHVFMGLRGYPHFVVAVQKACAGGQWIVRGTIDFTAFGNVVENLTGGETGHAFIINRDGVLQTGRPWSREKTIPGETVWEAFKALRGWLPHGPNGVCKPFCPDGKTLVVTATIKNGDWLLVYQQKNADIVSALMRTHKVAFGALFIGSVGIVVMALYLPTIMLLRIRREEEQNRS